MAPQSGERGSPQVLRLVQVGVEAALTGEILMATPLDDAPRFDDEDLVGRLDGGQASSVAVQ